MFDLTLAISTGILGVGLLFVSWRKQGQGSRLMVMGAWLLLLVSLRFWINAVGIEFGVVFGLMVPCLYAWAITLLASSARSSSKGRARPYRNGLPQLSQVMRNAGWFLLVIPGLCLTSTFTTIALMYLLPLEDVNRMASGALLLPLVWGALAAWLLIDKRMMRPVVANIVLGLCSSLYLFF